MCEVLFFQHGTLFDNKESIGIKIIFELKIHLFGAPLHIFYPALPEKKLENAEKQRSCCAEGDETCLESGLSAVC